ncbi:TatD family hydrolase [Sulfurospirillum sp. 1612]|uniref:TatD family hydrolase n=1 Tax=Sulfurospirillum sp. 1612 TaxID=3094835 RepID=UPI002F929C5F
MIIDTHCHLDDERYYEDLDEVIKRAEAHNVKAFLIPGADIKDLQHAREISHQYPNIFYAAGVHPDCIDGYDETVLRTFLEDERCIAVGECGLDYFRLPEDDAQKALIKQKQKEIFAKQIQLAKELNKPLIIHIRDANDDSRHVLEENDAGKVGGVLHCYNASKHLLPLHKLGFYFGIGGVLTFKNAKNLVAIVPEIPKERLLIETDAPYLTPHPYRGKRNEPAYTELVVEKLSQTLNLSVREIEDLTTHNAARLFKAFSSLI